VRAKWPSPEGTPVQLSTEEAYVLFNERSLGKGRLAVAKVDELDSYFSCTDIQSILSHRNDPLRMYNGPSMNCVFTAAPGGKQAAIHVLNFSKRAGGDGAVFHVKTPFRTARFVSPELAAPAALAWVPEAAGGAELTLPKFAVYGVIQLEN